MTLYKRLLTLTFVPIALMATIRCPQATAQTPPPADVHGEVVSLVNTLGTRSLAITAANRLIEIASASTLGRKEVVAQLLETVSRPPPPAPEVASTAAASDVAVGILGTLRASEAIPVLAANIARPSTDGGMGFGRASFPAAAALIEIGRACLPAVAKQLVHGDPETRMSAADVIATIGGAESRRILANTLSKENDYEVREAIKADLAHMK